MNALTHGLPDATAAPTSIGFEAEDPEVGRMVYHGLDPQHAPLVVELEPILADAVLDTAPLWTSGMTSLDIPGVGTLLETQEAHHVISRERTQGVIEQVIEHLDQARTIAPHQIGRDLAGIDAPVVRPEALLLDHLQPRVDTTSECVEQ